MLTNEEREIQRQIFKTQKQLEALVDKFTNRIMKSGNTTAFRHMMQNLDSGYGRAIESLESGRFRAYRESRNYAPLDALSKYLDDSNLVILCSTDRNRYARVQTCYGKGDHVHLRVCDARGNVESLKLRTDNLHTTDGSTKVIIPYFAHIVYEGELCSGDMVMAHGHMCTIHELNDKGFTASRLGEPRVRKYPLSDIPARAGFRLDIEDALLSIKASEWDLHKVVALTRALYSELAIDYRDTRERNINATNDFMNMFINPKGSIPGMMLMGILITHFIPDHENLIVYRERDNYWLHVEIDGRHYKVTINGIIEYMEWNRTTTMAQAIGDFKRFGMYAKQRKCTDRAEAIFNKYFI